MANTNIWDPNYVTGTAGCIGSVTAGNGSFYTGASTTGNVYFPNAGAGTLDQGIVPNAGTWVFGTGTTNTQDKGYYVLRVPVNKIPYKVYADGRLLALGMFGSAAQVSFAKNNKLIFSTSALNGCTYIAIEYKSCIYHYQVAGDWQGYQCEENSRILKSTLLSKIQQ